MRVEIPKVLPVSGLCPEASPERMAIADRARIRRYPGASVASHVSYRFDPEKLPESWVHAPISGLPLLPCSASRVK